MWYCKKCGSEMCRDEVAVYMRMCDRRATEFLCKVCLAEFYGCGTDAIDRKIDQFKRIGCVLFELDDPAAGLPEGYKPK